jgi:hypothetical protein
MAQDHEIRKLAYKLWEEEGRPEGKDMDHWSKAAGLLTAGPPTTATTRSTTVKAGPAKRSATAKKAKAPARKPTRARTKKE